MSPLYARVVRALRFLIRCFFREVEVSGLDYLPATGGGVLVSWHPNGLIDPGLILTHFPRPVIFGARHGLFKWPILGPLMRALGSVPIYRAMDGAAGAGGDAEARREANARSLDALAHEVAKGNFSCLFPEGDSHDSPHLLELKTGAARFYYRARELQPPGAPPPVIIPVGLHYDAKRSFRSNVLIEFHPPMTLDEWLAAPPPPGAPPQAFSERYKALTAEIERVLREVVRATESWELHHLMHRVRKMARAERGSRAGVELGKPKIGERTLGFARVWAGYYARLKTHPEQVERLKERVSEYNADLRALRIEDHELDSAPPLADPWLVGLLLSQVVFVFLLLPPILVVGYVVNVPPALGLWALTKAAAKRKKDEASIKLLFGIVAFPITWVIAGILAGIARYQLEQIFPALPNRPWMTGFTVATMGAIGGMVGVRYLRLVRETARAVRVRLTRARRRRALAYLKSERAALYDAVMQLVGDLDLPGSVTPEGRVVPGEERQGEAGWLR